ncbi:MAG: riboflavin biosynthesis protein RibF [Deltaproteobacteria bacterium]
MKTVRGIAAAGGWKSPVVAIGVFDGLHKGHKRILETCVSIARRTGGTSVVLTFWPHPQSQDSIYSLDHRLAIIGRLGIDICVVVRLDRAFASMTARQFIERVLKGRMAARWVLVGANFRFGRGLGGSVSTLKEFSSSCGYRLKVFPVMRSGGKPISSTRIRRCISTGRLEEARRLLGRRVSIFGTVAGGNAIGRTLGYPTANILPRHEVLPPDGIYAAKASVDGRKFPAILYKGKRPTFEREGLPPTVEVHLLRFSGDLYGKTMEVSFYKKLRDEKKFSSPQALGRAIARDIAAARRILRSS